MKLVVDASVAAKWLFSEERSQEALRLLDRNLHLLAPDLMRIEVANVLWKKARRNEISSLAPYLDGLEQVSNALAFVPSSQLVIRATALAVEIDHPVYDCVYLACAEIEDVPLITADKALHQRAAENCPQVMVWELGSPDVSRRLDEILQ